MGGLLGTKKPQPTLLDTAIQEYPILGKLGLLYKNSPRTDRGYMEFWPQGEPGSSDYRRPAEFPLDKAGIENYRQDSRPIDVMGDVSSHMLRDTDPLTQYKYMLFKNSLTPEQKQTLNGQYDYAKKNLGEQRPYDDWHETSGLPAMFRGYAFQQWPQEFNDKVYTPEQKASFDDLMNYYKGRGF